MPAITTNPASFQFTVLEPPLSPESTSFQLRQCLFQAYGRKTRLDYKPRPAARHPALIPQVIRLNRMVMLDAPIRRIAASPLERLADGLASIGVNANALTVAGFTMGLAAAALIADSMFLQAIIFLALNRFIDVIDGMVARRTRVTELCAFLDSPLK